MTFDLTNARLDQGYTMRALAEKLDVPESTVRRLERGDAAHPANMKKVADHFGIKVTDLMPQSEQAA